MPRKCLHCGKIIGGRADKKYCSPYCRSSYHNRLHKGPTNLMRTINKRLRRNRHILHTLNPEGNRKRTRLSRLDLAGFDFSYFTHTCEGRAGQIYYFCYDYGYRKLDHQYCLLVGQGENLL